MRPTLCVLVASLLVSACASSEVKTASSTTRKGIGGAVTQPLNDFNVIRPKIPPVLGRAHDAPYAHIEPITCEYIHSEVALLDDALGPDADVLDPATSNRADQSAAFVGKSAVSAVRDLTTGWIPFRSWVRTLTGAEQHSDALRRAVNAGFARRAYLKGMGQSQGCPVLAVAAPTVYPEPPPTPSSAGPPPPSVERKRD